MGELQPTLKEIMERNFAIEDEERKVRAENSKIKLPTPSPVSTAVVAAQPEDLVRIKGSLQDTVNKMREEEQRVYTDKIKHAEIILQGAIKNRDASITEYNNHNGTFSFFSRAFGLTKVLREQADKDTNWVVACEKQLELLRKEASGDKDPSKRHVGLLLFEKAEKSEKEGKIADAIALYREATYAIGGSPESRKEAIDRVGERVSSMNQDAVKVYMKGLQDTNTKLEGVVKLCNNWETGLKYAATAVVLAPTFFLSVPMGLAVGLAATAAYGLSHLFGQHVMRGRDFRESLQEAWGEFVGQATTVVKFAAFGGLFSAVGKVYGFLGQGIVRLIGNGGGIVARCVNAVRHPIITAKAAGSAIGNGCKTGWNALSSRVSAGYNVVRHPITATKNGWRHTVDHSPIARAFGFGTKATPLVPAAEATAVKFWPNLGNKLLDSGVGLGKAGWNIIKLPYTITRESVRAIAYPFRCGYGVYNGTGIPAAPFLCKQVQEVLRTGWHFIGKDPKWIRIDGAPLKSLFASTLAFPAALARGHIGQFIIGSILPSAPRALSTMSGGFFTGATVEGVNKVTTFKLEKPNFNTFLEMKYGEKFDAERIKLLSKEQQRELRKEYDDYLRVNRMTLRHVLIDMGIAGVTTSIAAVIRVKKPNLADSEKRALVKLSDEAERVALKLGASSKGGVAGGAAASWSTTPKLVKEFAKDALKIAKDAKSDIQGPLKDILVKDLGKFNTAELQRDLNKLTRGLAEGVKGGKTVLPYAPGKAPGNMVTTVPYPFVREAEAMRNFSRDVASRIPSNAYHNFLATAAPMAVHGYLTYVKNMIDPERRPSESVYSLSDAMNGMLYTMGGMRFGEGYKKGFDFAVRNSPLEKFPTSKIPLPFTEKFAGEINKGLKITPRPAQQAVAASGGKPAMPARLAETERQALARAGIGDIRNRTGAKLPEANKVMEIGGRRAAWKNLVAEVATDGTKAAVFMGVPYVIDKVRPDALPWLLDKLGFDPDALVRWFGRRATDLGAIQVFEENYEYQRNLRTKSINELYEAAAGNLGVSKKAYNAAPVGASLTLPSAAEFYSTNRN
jgi:hypothetical protein